MTLMVSPKDVDQQAIASISGMEIVTLPAVGLHRGRWIGFLSGFCKSYRLARRLFAVHRPDVVLAMGGFVSAPPVAAGWRCGARTFLHESNSIPGRANRWLARWVDGAFVYFPQAARRLRAKRVEVSGMPVRPQFLHPLTPAEARAALGLNPLAPLALVMGGSQGASKVNELALAAVPLLLQAAPNLQFMHLSGARDLEKVRAGYQARQVPALVRAFFEDMGTALAAADVAVSRAGSSSLAELAARRLPAVLIPYPFAADNHQRSYCRKRRPRPICWQRLFCPSCKMPPKIRPCGRPCPPGRRPEPRRKSPRESCAGTWNKPRPATRPPQNNGRS